MHLSFIIWLGIAILSAQARADAGSESALIQVGDRLVEFKPGTDVKVVVDPELQGRPWNGVSTPLEAILTVAEGAGAGAASYVLWILLHEGSHAAWIKGLGGVVTRFNFIPERREEDGSLVFAWVAWEDPEGRLESPAKDIAVNMAPNLTAFVAAAAGAALWVSGSLPDNRYARIPFTAFQAGAAMNLGVMFAISRSQYSDSMRTMEELGLDHREQTLMKAGMLTLSVLALVPAVDGLVHAVAGRTLFPHRDGRNSETARVGVVPIISPEFAGLIGRF